MALDIDRVIIIVFDSLGVGALPDAAHYGDTGSNTLANTAQAVNGLSLPTFQKMGLGNIVEVKGIPAVAEPLANFGKMGELSPGKDTLTGHWELAGLVLERAFPVYPNGFPKEVVAAFEAAIGREILGNKPASGTEIIKDLGDEHVRSGSPIVYTSADSVFQIAAHEEIIPVPELYHYCELARQILVGENLVARVIARPFVGEGPDSFRRTHRRRDYACEPPGETLLDLALEAGLEVWGVGKINDIFAGRGVKHSYHSESNKDSLDHTIKLIRKPEKGIVFTNLVDFDTLWGHRNDPWGYALGLEEADTRLALILNVLNDRDLIILTADHGCDPTTQSTDHSREYVPLLVFSRQARNGKELGTRRSFADVGNTVAELLGLGGLLAGQSFLSELQN